MRVPAAGGTPQVVTTMESRPGGIGPRWPEVLPGGRAILYVSGGTAGAFSDDSNIVVQSLKTGERKTLIQGGTSPHYLYTGDLVYAQGGRLLAVPFDLQRLEITGTAAPVLEDVWQGAAGYSAFGLSHNGSLAYVNGGLRGVGQRSRSKFVWVERKGIEQPILAPAHNYVMPRISPDGQHVAAGIEEGDNQIWLYDLRRENLSRLTLEGTGNIEPVWTPDGKRVVFKGAGNRLFWQPADGSADPEALTSSELAGENIPSSWTPDGQVLAFVEFNPNTGYDIYTLPFKDGKAQPFVRTSLKGKAPNFSPDGHFIAYVSDESGRWEIYVRPYPGPGGKWQISTEGGVEPAWNPKGRELFYRSGNKMMAVELNTQGTFSAGKPKMLFQGPYVPSPRSFQDYDVSPDGQHFLMLKPDETQLSQFELRVVLNWAQEVTRRVPTGK